MSGAHSGRTTRGDGDGDGDATHLSRAPGTSEGGPEETNWSTGRAPLLSFRIARASLDGLGVSFRVGSQPARRLFSSPFLPPSPSPYASLRLLRPSSRFLSSAREGPMGVTLKVQQPSLEWRSSPAALHSLELSFCLFPSPVLSPSPLCPFFPLCCALKPNLA